MNHDPSPTYAHKAAETKKDSSESFQTVDKPYTNMRFVFFLCNILWIIDRLGSFPLGKRLFCALILFIFASFFILRHAKVSPIFMCIFQFLFDWYNVTHEILLLSQKFVQWFLFSFYKVL